MPTRPSRVMVCPMPIGSIRRAWAQGMTPIARPPVSSVPEYICLLCISARARTPCPVTSEEDC